MSWLQSTSLGLMTSLEQWHCGLALTCGRKAAGGQGKLVLRARQPVPKLSASQGLACGITAVVFCRTGLSMGFASPTGTLVRPGSMGWPQHRGGIPPSWAPQMDWACLVIFIAIDAN